MGGCAASDVAHVAQRLPTPCCTGAGGPLFCLFNGREHQPRKHPNTERLVLCVLGDHGGPALQEKRHCAGHCLQFSGSAGPDLGRKRGPVAPAELQCGRDAMGCLYVFICHHKQCGASHTKNHPPIFEPC